jgi:hypothetical protein
VSWPRKAIKATTDQAKLYTNGDISRFVMLREGGASSKRRRSVITGSSACADDDRD